MKNIKRVVAAILLTAPLAANAIVITTDTTLQSQPSYSFGDYIFELVDPGLQNFNLLDAAEDFIVSNSCCAMDFTLRRLDNAEFSLLGIRFGGEGSHFVGGVSLPSALGNQVFQDYSFLGQAGVTGVSSVLFQPVNGYLQIAAFNVERVAVPEPTTLGLLGLGLVGMWFARRRRHT